MPIYEYKCPECHHELEALQKMSDPPLSDCPDCGKSSLVKKISAAAFRLAGSGWYETDFKSGNKKNLVGEGAKKEGGASSSADNLTSAKSTGASDSSKQTGDKTKAASSTNKATTRATAKKTDS